MAAAVTRRSRRSRAANTIATHHRLVHICLLLLSIVCGSCARAEIERNAGVQPDFHFDTTADEDLQVVFADQTKDTNEKSSITKTMYEKEYAKCPNADNKMMLSLVLRSSSWSDVLQKKQEKAIGKLSKFFLVPKEYFQRDDITRSDIYEMTKHASHKGHNQLNINHRLLGRLQLAVGCGKTLFPTGKLIVKQIEKQMTEGMIEEVSGLNFGWWAIWTKRPNNRVPRSKRQAAIEGSGDNDYVEYDGENDYDAEDDIAETPTTVASHHHRHGHNLYPQNGADHKLGSINFKSTDSLGAIGSNRPIDATGDDTSNAATKTFAFDRNTIIENNNGGGRTPLLFPHGMHTTPATNTVLDIALDKPMFRKVDKTLSAAAAASGDIFNSVRPLRPFAVNTTANGGSKNSITTAASRNFDAAAAATTIATVTAIPNINADMTTRTTMTTTTTTVTIPIVNVNGSRWQSPTTATINLNYANENDLKAGVSELESDITKTIDNINKLNIKDYNLKSTIGDKLFPPIIRNYRPQLIDGDNNGGFGGGASSNDYRKFSVNKIVHEIKPIDELIPDDEQLVIIDRTESSLSAIVLPSTAHLSTSKSPPVDDDYVIEDVMFTPKHKSSNQQPLFVNNGRDTIKDQGGNANGDSGRVFNSMSSTVTPLNANSHIQNLATVSTHITPDTPSIPDSRQLMNRERTEIVGATDANDGRMKFVSAAVLPAATVATVTDAIMLAAVTEMATTTFKDESIAEEEDANDDDEDEYEDELTTMVPTPIQFVPRTTASVPITPKIAEQTTTASTTTNIVAAPVTARTTTTTTTTKTTTRTTAPTTQTEEMPAVIITRPTSRSVTTTTVSDEEIDEDELTDEDYVDYRDETTVQQQSLPETTTERFIKVAVPVQETNVQNMSTPATTTTAAAVPTMTTTIATTTAKIVTETPSPPAPRTTTELQEVIAEVVNTAPMIKTRLPKQPVTAGKPFSIIVPADMFYDTEDENNLRLELFNKNENPVPPSSWIQYNAETREIYGLPLEEAVSRWQYKLRATDSEGLFVTETLDISVQQHKAHRSANHEISIGIKLQKKYPNNIDWQIRLIRGIVETVGDTSLTNVVVRDVRQSHQDPNLYTFVFTNETLPKDRCPDELLDKLLKQLAPEKLAESLPNEIVVKSVTSQLIGACAKSGFTKPKPTPQIAKNYPPLPRNQVDRVNATIGKLLIFKVPADTFYDPEDGVALKLSLLSAERTKLDPRHWLQFDSKNQEFYGIPKHGDAGQREYFLVAEDNEGLSASDALVVVVNYAQKRDYSALFEMTLGIPAEHFNNSASQRRFVERIAKIYGDTSPVHLQIRSIRSLVGQNGQTQVSFYNTTLYKQNGRCPEDEIESLRNVLVHQDSSVRDKVRETLGSEFNLLSVNIVPVGTCQGGDLIHHDIVPVKTEETPQPTFKDDYLLTFVLPAVIILTMLLVAAIIACLLHRRRITGKMELGDEEERRSFRSKGIPVIFQDELDEKPEIGNKSPIILKDEKPPLLPPSYNSTNPDESNDELDEYVPPPAVVMGGRENRGKSPVTPSYRKPPPYVSP